jgi:hypothetical protein
MESVLAIDKEKALTPREQYILENIALVDAFQDAMEPDITDQEIIKIFEEYFGESSPKDVFTNPDYKCSLSDARHLMLEAIKVYAASMEEDHE